jgi:hypothetical protein
MLLFQVKATTHIVAGFDLAIQYSNFLKAFKTIVKFLMSLQSNAIWQMKVWFSSKYFSYLKSYLKSCQEKS